MADNGFVREIEEVESEWVSKPSPILCARLADLLRQRGRLDESLEIATIGLKKWKKNTSIAIVLGKCYRDSGLLEKALDTFNEVHDTKPQNLVALLNLAEIHFQKKHWNKTIDYLEEYLFEHPGDEEARVLIEQAKANQIASKDSFYEENGDGSIIHTGPFPETERMTRVLKAQGIIPEPDGRYDKNTASDSTTRDFISGSLYEFFSEEEKKEFRLKSYNGEDSE